MAMLEEKVDALVRYVLANDAGQKVAALSDLSNLMNGRSSVPVSEEITAFLTELGVPVGPKGYEQLVTTLELAIKEPELLNNLYDGLFPKVAELCGTYGRRIERNIRYCIETAWEYGDQKVLKKYFANVISTFTGRPSTGAFIARSVREIRRRLGM